MNEVTLQRRSTRLSTSLSTRRNTRRGVMVCAGLLAGLVTFAAGDRIAAAHHAEVVASADCEGTVSYTSRSWTGDPTNSAGANPNIEISYLVGSNPPVVVENGSFAAHAPGTPGTPDSFSGTFAWPDDSFTTIWVFSTPLGMWGSGAASGQGGAAIVDRPTDCPGTPNPPTSTVVCTAASTATVTVTFSSTAGQDPSSYVVTTAVPAPAPSSFEIPAAGGSQDVVFTGVPSGTFVVSYSVNGAPTQVYEISVDCTPGTSTAVATVVCSAFQGTVTLTLTHTGGDLAVVYVVDGLTYTLNGDAPVTIVYTSVGDGTFSKTITNNGAPETVSVDVACDAVLTGAPICNEVDVNNVVIAYRYTLTNSGPLDVPVTWIDGSATVPAGGSVTVASGAPTISVDNNGTTAVTVTASTDVCGTVVRFEKQLVGQPPTGETYTVRVSRLVAPDYVTYLTFDLQAGVPREFELPSTLDGAPVTYRVTEIDAGTASLHTVSPDTFSVQGNLGETVSVVVTNSYASVEIDKQVSTTTVTGGDALTYALVATNTGGLTLDPVVISDSMPPNLSMISALVADGQGTCTLTTSSRPQLITCVMAAALAPGASTPVITIRAQVDVDTPVDVTIVNQAKVLGTYVGAPDPITGLSTAQSTAQSTGASTQAGRLRAELEGAELSCLPVVDGTVCDLSAKVGTLIEAGAASEAPVVTTPVTTAAPVLTTPSVARLPVTGSDGISMMLTIGLALVGLGAIVILVRRRPMGT